MKVLMVTSYFDSHRGGIELVAEKFFRGLARRNCEVIWAASGVGAMPAEETHASVLPLSSWNGLETLFGLPLSVPGVGAIRRLCIAIDAADVVLLHDCLYISNIVAFLYASFRGVPVMIVQHLGTVPYKSVLLKALMKISDRLVARPMLARAHSVAFISHSTAAHFASVKFRQAPAVVFNGVDCDIFRPLDAGESRDALRDSFGLPRRGRVALFVGRFVEKKGLGAMRHMVRLRQDMTWAFAGWGPQDPGRWSASNVKAFSNLHGASLAKLYRACDVLVLPSVGEGFPLVVQEALACGLPVVCGESILDADPRAKEYLKGVSIYAADEEQTALRFSSAIDEFLGEESDLKDGPGARRQFAISRYSWDYAIERHLELILRISRSTGSYAIGIEAGK